MKILGLPLHILVVHAVVILVPLAAVGGMAISALKWARLRYGWLVVVGAFGGFVSTFVAEQAGESFAETLAQQTAAIKAHISLGGGLTIWALLLFGGTVAVMLGQRLIDRDNSRGKIMMLVGIAVTVVTAVVAIIQTVRIGHSGSAAVWGG